MTSLRARLEDGGIDGDPVSPRGDGVEAEGAGGVGERFGGGRAAQFELHLGLGDGLALRVKDASGDAALREGERGEAERCQDEGGARHTW